MLRDDSCEEPTGPSLHIRGKIARIQVGLDDSQVNRSMAFWLTPSVDFVQTTKDGKCKVFAKDGEGQLFPVSTSQWSIENGMPTILFNVANADPMLKCFLLEVKINHIEVDVHSTSDVDDDGYDMDFAGLIDAL